jgi:hypothetical protein
MFKGLRLQYWHWLGELEVGSRSAKVMLPTTQVPFDMQGPECYSDGYPSKYCIQDAARNKYRLRGTCQGVPYQLAQSHNFLSTAAYSCG